MTGRVGKEIWKIIFSVCSFFLFCFFGVDCTEEALSLKLSAAVRFSLVISTISDAEMTGPLKTAAEQVVTYAVSKISYALSPYCIDSEIDTYEWKHYIHIHANTGGFNLKDLFLNTELYLIILF